MTRIENYYGISPSRANSAPLFKLYQCALPCPRRSELRGATISMRCLLLLEGKFPNKVHLISGVPATRTTRRTTIETDQRSQQVGMQSDVYFPQSCLLLTVVMDLVPSTVTLILPSTRSVGSVLKSE